jgi:hypothetical protein
MELKEIPGGSFWNKEYPGKVLQHHGVELVRDVILDYDLAHGRIIGGFAAT